MNIDQLKLILETASGLGNGAQNVAYFWLTLQLISTIAGWALGFYAITQAAKVIANIITSVSFAGEAMAAAGFHGMMVADERAKMLKAIRDAKLTA